MKSWLLLVRNHLWPLVSITALVVILAVLNYTPGTMLTGWDNLHPEFNFGLNIIRSFSAVWQEYQGVGLLGGMSHAADLTRQLFLLLLSVVLPTDILRYSWVWLSWWFGAVGTYALAHTVLTSQRSTVVSKAASTIAAVFYLLNLATMQYFYVPYESFSSFYAFLPWLLLGVCRYFQQPSPRRLSQLFLITVAATSAFYVQTLFVVFMILFAIIALTGLVSRHVHIKNILLAGLVIGAANLFWLLPSAYFTVTSSHVTIDSKVNRLSTQESQLMNQAYGTPLDIMLLRGYWFSYQDFQNNSYDYLIPIWRDHLQNGYVVVIGVGFWVLAVLGLLLSVKKEGRWTPAWLISFLVVTLMLTSGNGPLGFIFSWAAENVPLFGQIFRTAFTKWSTAAALIYALGIASFCYSILSKVKFSVSILASSSVIVVTVLLVCLFWPGFQGQLISPGMRLQQPAAYTELFQFFAQQPKQTRIAVLPLTDFWAWSFYNWEYRGSGFLWYGIEQPLLDRNFDVWSDQNETFYNELSTAIYGEDPGALAAILAKYHVTYLLVDESLQLPKKDAQALNVADTKEMLKVIGAQQVWTKDFLSVYQLPKSVTQFVTAPSQYTPLWEDVTFSRIDPALKATTSYILQPFEQPNPVTTYPFAALGKEEVRPKYADHQVIFEQQLPRFRTPASLQIPAVASGAAYTTKIKVERATDEILFSFAPVATVTVAGQERPFPQLPSLRLPVTEPITLESRVALTLNGQPVSLASGSAQAETWLTLSAAEPIQIKGDVTGEVSDRIDFEFPPDVWANVLSPVELTLPAGQHTVKVIATEDWTRVNTATARTQNCDVFKRGTFTVDAESQQARYQADNYASLCSGTGLPILTTQMAGLIRIQGTNVAGRSPKFYLTTPQAHRAILEELVDSHNFDNTFAILDWQNLPVESYGINWETRSFGAEAINQIDSLAVMPFDLRRVMNISVHAAESTPIQNTVALADNWKVATYQYGTTATVTGENGLITLSQGYHDGWIAVALPVDRSHGLSVLPHSVYNGWANAWTVPNGKYQIVIIFLPQLLEFFGLIVLLASGAGLTIFAYNNRQKSQLS